ncbi:hypothetical protein B0H11DRAFT_2243723 [Mycena galericulata]|nr:hypothetical protein B0H11DRAFT_2243723 [Mycena galericulata]
MPTPATRTRGSSAADNPLSSPAGRRTAGTDANPVVVNSSPPRTPGSTANPLVVHSSPLRQTRTSTAGPPRTPGSAANPLVLHSSPLRQTRASTRQSPNQTSAARTVASTRSARIAAASTPIPLRINRGPPSSIPLSLGSNSGVRGQPYPPGILGDLEARTAATRERNRARIDAESAAFRAAHPNVVIPRTRTRLRPAGQPKASDGARTEREDPLTLESLLANGIAPPARSTTREHQKCSICLHIKSHPVSYRCGHSHCYRCIRLWLETHWTCPECRTVMNEAPCRNYSEEAGILLDHPDWHDRSRVDYSWEGLRFPKVKLLSDW